MSFKKFLTCILIIFVFIGGVCTTNIFAIQPDFYIIQDEEHAIFYYGGEPEEGNAEIENLDVDYIESTNTYVITISGDVELNSFEGPAIYSDTSNISIVGDGELTINYRTGSEDVEYLDEDDCCMILCFDIYYEGEEEDQKDLTLTIGDAESDLTLNLNAIKNPELLELMKHNRETGEDGIEYLLMLGVIGSDINIENTEINTITNGYAFYGMDTCNIKNSELNVEYLTDYYQFVIGLACMNGITVDNSKINVSTENGTDKDFCAGLLSDGDINVINDSLVEVNSSYNDEDFASIETNGDINIVDSEVNLIGNYSALYGNEILIKNSNFLLSGQYTSLIFTSDYEYNSGEETRLPAGLDIQEDETHGGIFERKTTIPEYEDDYYGLLTDDEKLYDDDSTINIQIGETRKIIAGANKEEATVLYNNDPLFDLESDLCYAEISRLFLVKFFDGVKEYTHLAIKPNSLMAKPQDPVKEGYKFEGWYSDEELTTPFDFNSPITKDIKLYAKWSVIEEEPEEKQEDKPYRPYIVPKTGIK